MKNKITQRTHCLKSLLIATVLASPLFAAQTATACGLVTGIRTSIFNCVTTINGVTDPEIIVRDSQFTISTNHAVDARANGGTAGKATIIIEGNNTFSLTGNGDTALLARTDSASPLHTASILVTEGSTLNATHAGMQSTGNERDALEITTTNGANGSIVFKGTGSVSTVGGNPIYLQLWKGGNALADIGSDVDLILDTTTNQRPGQKILAGIMIKNTTGLSTVISAANITSTGTQSYGIFVQNNIAINSNSNTATGVGLGDGSGIIDIKNVGTIHTHGESGSGIHAETGTGEISITSSSSIITDGDDAHGIRARSTLAGANGIVINTAASAIIKTEGKDARGILATSLDADIAITHNGLLTTEETGATGIELTSDTGAITLINSDRIATRGDSAHGLLTLSAGITQITSIRDITTLGDTSHAINATGTGNGDVIIDNTGEFETFGDGSHGIMATGQGTGSVNIKNTGEFTTYGTGSHALTATSSSTGSGDIILKNSGLLRTTGDGSFGLAAIRDDISNSNINIANMGDIITAGSGSHALYVDNNGAGHITINNSGTLTATGTDAYALWVEGIGNNVFNFTNTGTLSGMVNVTGVVSSTNITNNEEWNLAPTGGTGTATSDFGTNSTIDNIGRINVDNATPGVATINRLTNVDTFINRSSGIIDLQTNSSVGDTLTISGNGGTGTFKTGGVLLLDTVLNQGGSASQSDSLTIDNTQIETGPTKISIKGTGVGVAPNQMEGNGILVVKVEDTSAASSHAAFSLQEPVIAGIYEYQLFQGAAGAMGYAIDNNWYLRSASLRDDLPLSTGQLSQATTMGFMMMAGTTAASLQGDHAFDAHGGLCSSDQTNSSLSYYCEAERTQARGARAYTWGRIIAQRTHSTSQTEGLAPTQYRSTTTGMQAGVDLINERYAKGASNRAGLYFGMVRSKADVAAESIKIGNSTIDAYSLGGYWTHGFENGWYAKTVAQASYYSLSSRSRSEESTSTNGFGLGASLALGRTLALGDGYTLTPQAEISHQYIKLDEYSDTYSRIKQAPANSTRGQVAVRLAKTSITGTPEKPQALHWWVQPAINHTLDSSTKTAFAAPTGEHLATFKTPLGQTTAEISAGISGKIAKSTTLFADAAYERNLGGRNLDSWRGTVGIKVRW